MGIASRCLLTGFKWCSSAILYVVDQEWNHPEPANVPICEAHNWQIFSVYTFLWSLDESRSVITSLMQKWVCLWYKSHTDGKGYKVNIRECDVNRETPEKFILQTSPLHMDIHRFYYTVCPKLSVHLNSQGAHGWRWDPTSLLRCFLVGLGNNHNLRVGGSNEVHTNQVITTDIGDSGGGWRADLERWEHRSSSA